VQLKVAVEIIFDFRFSSFPYTLTQILLFTQLSQTVSQKLMGSFY
jgi:hypothetical protein